MDHQDKSVAIDNTPFPAEEPVKARLKWFNMPKGFGFVVPENEPETDAFLHITVLQRANIKTLGDEALLLCHIHHGGPKGAHVTHIVELLDEGQTPAPLISVEEQQQQDDNALQDMDGVVKWYNPDKEFGFVVPDDGQKDVFIHKSCLEKHRITNLVPGQHVSMTFRTVPKGREVVDLKIKDDHQGK